MPKPIKRSPHAAAEDLGREFEWLGGFGLVQSDIARLQPTVPGTLTSATSYYVNSMLPKLVFRGREQGSLPLTSGRWFLIPLELVMVNPRLREAILPPAAAVSRLANDGPRSIAAWTEGG